MFFSICYYVFIYYVLIFYLALLFKSTDIINSQKILYNFMFKDFSFFSYTFWKWIEKTNWKMPYIIPILISVNLYQTYFMWISSVMPMFVWIYFNAMSVAIPYHTRSVALSLTDTQFLIPITFIPLKLGGSPFA